MLQTPDGNGVLELFEYIHPDALETSPTRPNDIGMHRVAFSVDNLEGALAIAARHGCHPLRGVATYEDVYKLTYVRGPSGIIVMLAERCRRTDLVGGRGDDGPGLQRRILRSPHRSGTMKECEGSRREVGRLPSPSGRRSW